MGEPVDEFRVTGGASHASEVVGSMAEAATEVIVPDPVHDAAPSERVVWGGNPISEGGPTGLLLLGMGEGEPSGKGLESGQGTGLCDCARLLDVATVQQVHDLGRGLRVVEFLPMRIVFRNSVDQRLGGERLQLAIGMGLQRVGRDGNLLGFAATLRFGVEGVAHLFRQKISSCAGGLGEGELESPEEMAPSVELFEIDHDAGAGLKRYGVLQLEDGMMRLAHLGIDSPRGFRVAVEGMGNGPVDLIPVGGRTGELESGWLRGAGIDQLCFELAEMQVAVVLSARAIHGQAFVGKDIEANAGK